MPSIHLGNIGKSYGTNVVLSQVNLDLPDKSLVGLLGPNGAGKTTLLHILAGILPPDKGRRQIVDLEANRELHRNEIGFCSQSSQFWRGLTALEQMVFTIELYGKSRELFKGRIDLLFESLHLTTKRNSFPNQMSGGEQKRLQIAISLLMQPKLLILDEPIANLDWESREFLRGWLPKLARDENLTVITTSHDFEDIFELANKFIVLVEGQVQWSNLTESKKITLLQLKETYLNLTLSKSIK